MSGDLATLVAVCEKAAQSKFPVTIDPAAVLPVVREAATALTEARAEIERLKSCINGIVNCQGPMTRAQVREVCAEILDNKTVWLNNQSPFAEAMFGNKARAEKAESALAEAVEVLMPLVARYEPRIPELDPGKYSNTIAELKTARRFIASQEPAEQEK